MAKKQLPKRVQSPVVQRWLLQFYLFVAFIASDFRDRLVDALEKLQMILANETEQTKEMLQIYILQTQGKARPEDVLRANKQFRDLIRSAGLGFIIILPFAPITLPLIVRLGRRLGVEVLPDSIRDLPKTPPRKKSSKKRSL